MNDAIQKELNNDGVLKLSLNRPEVLNAMNADLIMGLLDALYEAKSDKKVRSIIITGNGRGFCAGADLKWIQSIASEKNKTHDKAMKMSMKFGEIFTKISSLSKVTISVVEGACMAGAVGIASATDFLVSTSDAIYALTETKIGLTPAQIAPYVIKKVGFNIGRKLMLVGEIFNGQEALLIGMADYVVKD